MTPLQYGEPQRQLFGFHHPAVGQPRRTAVLICSSWGLEHMRAYRGLRGLAQRLAAAGFETLRFDYSGTGDSGGHGLDARLEHWLADIRESAQELRDISGADEVAVIGVRFGALLTEAARLRLAFRARLFVHWDAPDSGLGYIALMQKLQEEADRAKRWRRHRDMQLPSTDPLELCFHAWPQALANEVATLTAPLPLEGRSLWYQSSDQPLAAGVPAGAVLSSRDVAHWSDIRWVYSPWNPAAASARLVEHLAKVLP